MELLYQFGPYLGVALIAGGALLFLRDYIPTMSRRRDNSKDKERTAPTFAEAHAAIATLKAYDAAVSAVAVDIDNLGWENAARSLLDSKTDAQIAQAK